MTRIDGMNPLNTGRTSQGQAAQAVGSGSDRQADAGQASGPQDNITLSSRSRMVADVARHVVATPDARAAQVAALRAAIADGSYRINAGDIAARLMATGTFGAEA